MISRSVVPIGISTNPVLAILPPKAKTFVPLDFSVPIDANHALPFKIIPLINTKSATPIPSFKSDSP